METPRKVSVLLLIIAIVAIEVHSEFVQHELKKFYVERDMKLNWFEAWNFCRENNMELISIETELEQRLLQKTLGEIFILWTAGNENASPSPNKTNRAFVWGTTGRAVQYTNWRANEPNNLSRDEHCISIFWDFGWNDDTCLTKRYGFICQYR